MNPGINQPQDNKSRSATPQAFGDAQVEAQVEVEASVSVPERQIWFQQVAKRRVCAEKAPGR